MNLFVNIEEFYRFKKVHYYSVHFEGEALNETDKFIDKLDREEAFQEELDVLLAIIEEIGEERGAASRLFRHEAAANALPPPVHTLRFLDSIDKRTKVTLRLYCLRLTENIVVLFNGGVKTKRNAQDCPNVARFFEQANKLTKLIDKKIVSGELKIRGKKLLGDLELVWS